MLHVVTTGAYYPPVVTTRAHICHEYHEFYLSRGEMSASIQFQIYVEKNLCGENMCGEKMTGLVTTWKILTTGSGASYLTTGTLCTVCVCVFFYQ